MHTTDRKPCLFTHPLTTMTDVDRSEGEIVNNFVSTLKALMNDLAKRRPSDAIVGRARKRLNTAADMFPITIMEIAGPYLYQHRKDILSEEMATWQRFFTDPNAFKADLESAEDASKRDAAEYLIPKIQEIVGGMEDAKQSEYIETVRELLDDYMDWHLLTGGGAQ